MILVSSADIFLSKSLRIHAERITQKGIVSPPEKVCDTPPIEEGDIHSALYLGEKFSPKAKKGAQKMIPHFSRTLLFSPLPILIPVLLYELTRSAPSPELRLFSENASASSLSS